MSPVPSPGISPRRVAWFAAFVCVLGVGLGASEGPAQAAAARSRFDRALRSTKNLTADYRQFRSSKALGQGPVTAGTLQYESPGRWRFTSTGKTRSTVYVNEDTVWFYQPDRKSVVKSRSVDAGGPSTALFGPSVAALERHWKISEIGAAGLRFVPRDGAAGPWRRFEVTLDPRTGLPRRVVLLESEDERVTLELSNLKVNRKIVPTRFPPVFPAGTNVVAL